MRRAGWRVAASCAVLGLGSMTMGCASQPVAGAGPAAEQPNGEPGDPSPAAEAPSLPTTETGYVPRLGRGSYPQIGRASYYAAHFTGRRTAFGTRFDPRRATIAHRTLPFGTVVRITNLENGRSETATVEDRGPFTPGRIVDMSRSLAERLDMIRQGVVRVEVTPVEMIPVEGTERRG